MLLSAVPGGAECSLRLDATGSKPSCDSQPYDPKQKPGFPRVTAHNVRDRYYRYQDVGQPVGLAVDSLPTILFAASVQQLHYVRSLVLRFSLKTLWQGHFERYRVLSPTITSDDLSHARSKDLPNNDPAI